MLIDPFPPGWQDYFLQRATQLAAESKIFLLIDGAFIPGLFRSMGFALTDKQSPALLFETLPACNEDTRDVSPFLVPVLRESGSLAAVLDRCSGWPMISAIETEESLAQLHARLAAWCIIEVPELRFNFRFPDTRRLPKIFDILTAKQRAEFSGPAHRWDYIGRTGTWQQLDVGGQACETASQPMLDENQFAALVSDSEPDEVLIQLAYRGYEPEGTRSVYYEKTCMALRVADANRLEQTLRLDWCEFVLTHGSGRSEADLLCAVSDWAAHSGSASYEREVGEINGENDDDKIGLA